MLCSGEQRLLEGTHGVACEARQCRLLELLENSCGALENHCKGVMAWPCVHLSSGHGHGIKRVSIQFDGQLIAAA